MLAVNSNGGLFEASTVEDNGLEEEASVAACCCFSHAVVARSTAMLSAETLGVLAISATSLLSEFDCENIRNSICR
jgi:hypothetical protein